MARNGIAKGANKGFVTEERVRKAKPSQSKGVSYILMPQWSAWGRAVWGLGGGCAGRYPAVETDCAADRCCVI